MFQTAGRFLRDVSPVELDWPWNTACPDSANVWAHESSGSGGYSDHLFKYAARELFGIQVDRIEYKNLRNPDFREAILEVNGQVCLRFAIANGFRNIQNLVQKLKRGKSSYHYVEVMACPSGELITSKIFDFLKQSPFVVFRMPQRWRPNSARRGHNGARAPAASGTTLSDSAPVATGQRRSDRRLPAARWRYERHGQTASAHQLPCGGEDEHSS